MWNKKIINKRYALLILSIMVVVGIITILITLSNSKPNTAVQEGPEVDTTSTATEKVSEPLNEEVITWVSKIFDLGKREAMENEVIAQLAFQMPENWTAEVATHVEEISYTINDEPITKQVNCYTFEIKDPSSVISLTIKEICKGWGAAYTSYDSKMTIVSKLLRGSHSGPSNYYTVRISKENNNYEYVGSLINQNESLEDLPQESTPVMDALTVGFPPPNENLYDFYFIVANASLKLNKQDNKLIEIADKIVASLHLRPGVDESIKLQGKSLVKISSFDGKPTYVAVKLAEGWVTTGRAPLSKIIDGKEFHISMQTTEADYLNRPNDGNIIIIKTIKNDEGKIFHAIKTRHYLNLSSCVPQYVDGCSLMLDDKYFFVSMHEYQMGDQYVRELDFTNPATDIAIAEFESMMSSLSF